LAAIRKAFHIAVEGRPGSVLIDIPRDIFLQDIKFVPKQHDKMLSDEKPNTHFLSCIAEVVTLIQQARRPIVIAGGGIISANASKKFFHFIETFKHSIGSTLMGLGSYPPNNKIFLGFSGLHGSKTATYTVAEADLIIAVGSRFGDRQTGSGSKYVIHTRFIHIDIDPAEIDKNIFSSIGLAGDMKTILHLLIQHAKGTIHEL
jgi:acetolactate synthase I/II/III large subunit